MLGYWSWRLQAWARRRRRLLSSWFGLLVVGAVVVVAAIYVVFWPLSDLIASHNVGATTGPHRAAALQAARDAAQGRLLTFGAGLFAFGALTYTALNFSLSRQGQVTDRYTKAIEQLGSDKLDVRIGGIYALERIAHDSGRDHPTVIEVLVTFIREHSHEPWSPAGHSVGSPVSHIRPDVQAALTAVGRRKIRNDRQYTNLAGAVLTYADLKFRDFTRADFASVDLTGADLNGTIFTDAKLIGAKLTGANLSAATLRNADLTGADLADADLSWADLTDTNLTDANLSRANLTNARFIADLRGANLTRAQLIDATVTNAIFKRRGFLAIRGVNLTDADLTRANLTGAKLIDVDLPGADLTEATWPTDAAVPAGWQRDTDSGRLRRG